MRLRLSFRKRPGAISLAVAGNFERDLSVEQLRERLSALLRRYVPPTTLPTPIMTEAENGEEGERPASLRNPDQSYSPGVDR